MWWKRYTAFVAAVGGRENAAIQAALATARAQAAKQQPQVLELVELAINDRDKFFGMFTSNNLADLQVAQWLSAALTFLPLGYQQTNKKDVSAAIVAVEANQPRVAALMFGDKVTRALADPEVTAMPSSLTQSEAQLLARMVMKQDYITALVQAGILAADDANSVIVDTLLMQNQKMIDRVDARVTAARNTYKYMYMLQHSDATVQQAEVKMQELDTVATTGPLRADSTLRAQRAELGAVAGLATGAPFHNTLLTLSFWVVHNRQVQESQLAELRNMIEGTAASSQGTCNYDTYMLPTIATSLFQKSNTGQQRIAATHEHQRGMHSLPVAIF